MLTNYKNAIGKFLSNKNMRGALASGANICNGLEDPSFLAFTLIISDKARYGLFGNNSLGVAGSEKDQYPIDFRGDYVKANYSAREYAESITKVARNSGGSQALKYCYGNLNAFIKDFQKICTDYPYFFQKVSGISEAYKKYLDMNLPTVMGDDSKITVECLESADLRMHSIFDCYLKAVYDLKWRRQIIPDNLLAFNIDIVVHDMRRVLSAKEDAPDIRHIIGDHGLTMVVFRFYNCKFLVNDGLEELFANVNNNEPQQSAYKFVFSYGNMEVFVDSISRYAQKEVLYNENSSDLNTLGELKDISQYAKQIREILEPESDDTESSDSKYNKSLGENVHTGSLERTLGYLGSFISSVTGRPRDGLSIPGSAASLSTEIKAGTLGQENVYEERERSQVMQAVLNRYF